MYNNIFFNYCKIYLLYILLFPVNNFLAFPFGTINLRCNQSSDYFSKIFSNDIYINLTLGTPNQMVKALLKMEFDEFLIYNNAYKYNESSSYQNLDKNKQSYSYFLKEKKSEDIFYFQNFNSYNELLNNEGKSEYKKVISTLMNFKLVINNGKDFSINWSTNDKKSPLLNNYGIVGLRYPVNNYSLLFVHNLKQNKVINNYSFSLIFSDYINNIKNSNINYNIDNNGYFILGEDLNGDEINDIKYTRAEKRYSMIEWEIIFDEIYSYQSSQNKEGSNSKYVINKAHQVELVVNKPYIVGTKEYESFIYDNFFKDLMNKDVCNKAFISINNIYYGYICDNSSELFTSALFPDLHFYNRELQEIFNLTKKDLFYYEKNYNNKDEHFCYFMILFSNIKLSMEKTKWSLGIPFFKKFRFMFDYDKKLVGFYSNMTCFISRGNVQNGNKSNKKIMIGDNYNGNLKISVIIILIIVILFLIYFIYIKYFSKIKRKNKLNELDDDYDYETYKKEQLNINKNKDSEYNIELVNKNIN